MCLLVLVCGPHQDHTEWLLPLLLQIEGSLILLSEVFSSHAIHMVRITVLGAWHSHLIPLPCLHGGNGSSLPGFVTPKRQGLLQICDGH